MTNYEERRKLIRKSLRVEPLSHGKVHVCLIKLLTSSEILPERYEIVKHSLEDQGTNLIPLILRRISLDIDEKEYEVIYGDEWYIIANELGIETLWAWVFDLNDDELSNFKSQMSFLFSSSGILNSRDSINDTSSSDKSLSSSSSFSEHLTRIEERIDKISQNLISNNQFSNLLDSKLSGLNSFLVDSFTRIEERIDKISQDPVVNRPVKPEEMNLTQLKAMAREYGIPGYSKLKKMDLITAINSRNSQNTSI